MCVARQFSDPIPQPYCRFSVLPLRFNRMGYHSLEACLLDLEKNGQLVRVKEPVDPYLQLAAIHLRVHEARGPALLFENVKGSRFRAASNIFGTLERSEFIFRDSIEQVRRLIDLKLNPAAALKRPFRQLSLLPAAFNALPKKNPWSQPVIYQPISISDLPLIHHWPMDGGAFVTLPQVYTEDPEQPGIPHSNLGMYRIQLNGNEYTLNKEIGLHYQLHRGIGVHQTKANRLKQPLKVSIFVGGPPAHTVAAVMPLPEGLSELNFAGVLGNRRFRYAYKNGFAISTEADFVITGEVMPGDLKPEGPFGDHLGYYSLQHPFPVLKVHQVFARQNAIWPFTVVGRPPQEDTSFGQLIHHLTGAAIRQEIPGVQEVHAVDAAGVHPLLLATASERYTPYAPTQKPAEILTIANRILGTGQLSLAKFLFITADDTRKLKASDIPSFFRYFLERFQPERDLHFYTQTTIDTLDYSGNSLNSGSKVVLAAYGEPVRQLATELPDVLKNLPGTKGAALAIPGVAVLQAVPFTRYENVSVEMERLNSQLHPFKKELAGIPLLVLADDASFAAASLNNFLWIAFTRANPSHDIYGVGAFTAYKHWGCTGPVIIDARRKPHHAPPVEKDPGIEKSIDRLFEKGGSLHGILH